MTRRSVICVALLLATIAIAYGDILFGARALFIQDLVSYHFSMKHIVREAVRSGEFPYWNPYYSAGQPLAANPVYELFYPPQWLVYFLPFAYAYQLHIVIHFFIAAIGMFLLIRSFGVKPPAAALGAAAFVFGGPYLSLSSKLPFLFSISWMPLVLLLVRRTIDRFTIGRAFAAGAVMALQLIVGEPTIVLQTWALIAGYAIVIGRGRWRPVLMPIVTSGAIAALLAAVQVLPAIDFARDTVRSRGLTYAAVADWSFPFARVAGFILPSLKVVYPGRSLPFLFEVYLGALFVVLAIAGVVAGVRGRWLFVAAFCLSVFVAMGDNTPLLRLLYNLKLASFLRYPEKFILTTAFVLAIWSAIVIQKLLDCDRPVTRSVIIVASVWAFVSLFLGVINIGRAGVVLVAVVIVAGRRGAWRPALLAVVAVADLWFGTRAAVPRMPAAFFDPPALESQLNGGRIFHDAAWAVWNDDPIASEYFGDIGHDRFWWMLRNGECWNLAAAWSHALALEPDIDATSLKNTDDFRMAFNLAHLRGADAPYLRMANVGAKIVFKTLDDSTRNAAANDPVHFTPVTVIPIETTPRYSFVSPDRGQVLASAEGWNHIKLTVRADGRAFLVASVTGHKYWRATIDGQDAPIVPANIAFQGVIVPAGTHTIEWRYRNPLVAIGGVITLLTFLVFSGAALLTRRSHGMQTLFI